MSMKPVRAIDTLMELLGRTPVKIGLRQQGHIPTVKKLLAEGKSWEEIGREIHWDARTARQWYERDQLNQRIRNNVIEEMAVYIERDSNCLMPIVVKETKHDYGVRLLKVMAAKLRDLKETL